MHPSDHTKKNLGGGFWWGEPENVLMPENTFPAQIQASLLSPVSEAVFLGSFIWPPTLKPSASACEHCGNRCVPCNQPTSWGDVVALKHQ